MKNATYHGCGGKGNIKPNHPRNPDTWHHPGSRHDIRDKDKAGKNIQQLKPFLHDKNSTKGNKKQKALHALQALWDMLGEGDVDQDEDDAAADNASDASDDSVSHQVNTVLSNRGTLWDSVSD